MMPPPYCEPCQAEKWPERESWGEDETIQMAKTVQNRLEFIDQFAQQGLIWYEQSNETPANIEQEFQRLANEWRSQTRNLSSMMKITHNEAYRQIVNMGPKIIPTLLRELQSGQDLWFSALREITSENPVRPEHAGNVKKMREAWIDWARKHQYL